MLPLTRDILTFKDYVTEIANTSVDALREEPNNLQQCKKLVDAALKLTILYNSKRIGDVQYTRLETYMRNFNSSDQEELMSALVIKWETANPTLQARCNWR